MSQSAEPACGELVEPAVPVAFAATGVPAELLRPGEVVILAVKPSGWFVVLASWGVLAVVGILAGGAYLAGELWGLHVAPPQTLWLLWLLAGGVRILLACFQWLGRLYVLTNLRVMRIRGVLKPHVLDCPLECITNVGLSASRAERVLALGSLCFESAESSCNEAAWVNIARPFEILQIVREAIHRTK